MFRFTSGKRNSRLFKVGDVSCEAKNASGLASSSKINIGYQKLKWKQLLKE
jgi:hypothetical protein